MRVGTWNLNHGGRGGAKWPEQLELLQHERLDLVVLTEPAPDLSSLGGTVVVSPPGPEGWSWVAVAGPGLCPVEIEIPFGRMSAAAVTTVAGRDVVVYGSVLPWRSIAGQTSGILDEGESYSVSFARLLREQSADVARLRATFPDAVVIWAGDFNQSLVGTEYVGSKHQRVLLEEALAGLHLTAWNRDCAHRLQSGMHTIDLVCGPSDISKVLVTEMSGSLDSRRLSDHAGYVVSFEL